MPATPNDFTAAAVAFIRRGWRVVPLSRAVPNMDRTGKSPTRKGWQRLRLTEAQAIAHWRSPRAGNIGVITGPASGLVILDIDDPEVYHCWSREHPEAVNTYTVARDNAPAGRVHLYFSILAGEAAPSSASGPGWDFLSTGKQAVTAPSLHYSGGTYAVVRDVPLLPWKPEYMPAKAPRSEPDGKPEPEPVEIPKTDAARLSEALATIPPDICRDDWIRVGMALHSFDIKVGLALWDRWSRRGEKYVKGEPAAVWQGFKPDGKIGVGTLFAIAQRYGYRHRGKAPAFAHGRMPADIIRTGRCKGMAAADLAVLMAVAVTVNERTGYCRIQHETIAGYFGTDPRTVRRAVARLVERGLLLETRTGRANVYRWGLLSADRTPVSGQAGKVSDRTPASISDRTPVSGPQNNAHAREDVTVCGLSAPSRSLPNCSPNGIGVDENMATPHPARIGISGGGRRSVYIRPDRS